MIRLSGKDEHPVRLAFLAVVLSLFYLSILLPAGFLEGARLRSYDAYCRWRSTVTRPPKETSELLLVTVDEESHRRLGKKWPWDRTVFAEFITKVTRANPSLIALDFVLSGASDPAQDEALAQAIRSGPPILLASYMDQHGDPVLPHTLFSDAGGIPGLLNHPRDIDLTVRRLYFGTRLPMHPQPLFATEVNAAAIHRRIPLPEIRLEPRLFRMKIGTQAVPLEPPIGCIAINTLLTPAQISAVSFWQVMEGQAPADQIKGKVVLVGSTREITHDVYPTSLGLMPGVMISANGILTLLSGEFVRPLPLFPVLLLGFLFALAIMLAAYWLPIPLGAAAAGGMTLLGVGSGFLCLLLFNLRAESLSIYILGAASWLTAVLYKYLLLVAESVRLHRHVVTDPISGAVTERYFRLRLEAGWAKRKQSRKPLSLVVVQMEPISMQLHQAAWPEVQKRIRVLAETLRRHVKTRDGLVGRLGDEQIAVFLPGMDLEQTRSWTEGARKELSAEQGHLAFGIACTEHSSLLSPNHLLQAANTASRRSWTEKNRAVESYDPARDGAEQLEKEEGESSQGLHALDYVASELEDRNQALEKALGDLRSAHKEMESHFLEVTKTLVMALETKDEYTAGHLERVSRYATRLAEVLRLPPEEIAAIREAALLHDIGKIGLPDAVLHKVGRLTDEEVAVIRQHLAIGAKILEPMKFFKPITSLIYHHHERYDGKGYPHGLTGEFIPPGAQVIAIADSFDAMTTHRGYNKPLNVHEALEEMRKGSGTQFHPAYVEAFMQVVLREGPHLAGYTPH
jgi:putative nucleotidyltransferase with HDIG domain